jgi:hypothetical protein
MGEGWIWRDGRRAGEVGEAARPRQRTNGGGGDDHSRAGFAKPVVELVRPGT